MRGAVAVDAVELAAAGEATSTLRRHLGSEALPPFAPASLEDGAAATGAHPRSEPVRLRPLPLLGLVGPLHPGRSIGRLVLAGICGSASPGAARAAAMVGRRCPTTRIDITSRRSGEIAQERLRVSRPGLDLQALARAAADGRGAGRHPLPHRSGGAPGLGRAALRVADPRGAARRRDAATQMSASPLAKASREAIGVAGDDRAQPQLHLRALRDRRGQPARPRGGTRRRRGSLRGL